MRDRAPNSFVTTQSRQQIDETARLCAHTRASVAQTWRDIAATQRTLALSHAALARADRMIEAGPTATADMAQLRQEPGPPPAARIRARPHT